MSLRADQDYRKTIFFLLFLFYLVAILYSKYMLSMCMIAFGLFTLLDWHSGRPHINQELLKVFQNFSKHLVFLAPIIYFSVILLSGIYSEHGAHWMDQLRQKTPYLVLPIIFITLPSITKREYLNLHYIFFIICCFSGLHVFLYYLFHFKELTYNIGSGHAIPTPIDHVKYSILLAFNFINGVILYNKKHVLKYGWERPLILGLSVFLFLLIHLLSVRSGLAVLYGTIFVFVIRFIIQKRKYAQGFFLLAALFVLPYLAFKTIPSVKNKYYYTMHDIRMWQSGQGEGYSDAGRFESMKMGIEFWKSSPIIGIGAGDLKSRSEEWFSQKYPEADYFLQPHNQFIRLASIGGIVGLGAFLCSFFIPLFYRKNHHEPLFLSLHLVLFFSFFVESTLERSYSIAWYLFFLLIGLSYLNRFKRNKEV